MMDFFLGKKDKKIEETAKKLGFERILFVKQIEKPEYFNKLEKEKNKRQFDACLIKTKNLEIMRKFIDKAYNFFEYILVLGTSDEINRSSLEHKKVFALVAPEFSRGKDFLYQRNAGLNHVLCKLARANKKSIIFRFSDITEAQNKSLILGKIAQSIKICKKYGTNYLFINFCSHPKEMMHEKELKILEKLLLVDPFLRDLNRPH